MLWICSGVAENPGNNEVMDEQGMVMNDFVDGQKWFMWYDIR